MRLAHLSIFHPILTGGFVMLVKKLALKTYAPDADKF